MVQFASTEIVEVTNVLDADTLSIGRGKYSTHADVGNAAAQTATTATPFADAFLVGTKLLADVDSTQTTLTVPATCNAKMQVGGYLLVVSAANGATGEYMLIIDISGGTVTVVRDTKPVCVVGTSIQASTKTAHTAAASLVYLLSLSGSDNMISTSMRAIVELSPREPIVWTPVAPAVAPLPYCAGGSYLSAGPAACMTVAESVNLTRSAFAHCQQPFSWPQITRSNETMVRTGGLGELLEEGGYEVWVCVRDHECGDPWFCWVWHETDAEFRAWGLNSELKLIRHN